MSTEAFHMMKHLNKNQPDTQIALQCAPLLMGMKISNLLTVPSSFQEEVRKIFSSTGISFFPLYQSADKITFFVYRRNLLVRYLNQPAVWELMRALGYEKLELETIFRQVSEKYGRHMEEKQEFPHEVGLLLGYPPEDVKGFIRHKGQNFLYTGYWKVYGDPQKCMKIFEDYDLAREQAVRMIYKGLNVRQILHSSWNYQKQSRRNYL